MKGNVAIAQWRKMSKDCFPQISGTWTYNVVNLRRKSPQDIPSFSDIITTQYNVTIQQQDQFIIVTVPPSPPLRPTADYQLGVITKVYQRKDNFWQITLADFDDNGTINLTIKECKNGKPSILQGYYVESGFSTTNPDQNQAIAQITWTKIQ